MKNNLHLIFFALLSLFSLNLLQAQDLVFSKVYDDLENGMGLSAYTIIPTFDTSYLLIGATEENSASNITKVNQYGDVVWGKTYSFNSYFHLNLTCATPTYDSAFLVTGSIKNETTNKKNNFLMKINDVGDTLWTATYGAIEYHNHPMSVEQTIDSGFIISGYTYHEEGSIRKINVFKTDKNGQLEWAKLITLTNLSNIAYCAKQIADSSYIITGRFNDSQSIYNSFVMNLSELGAVNWVKKMSINGNTMCINDFVLEGNDMVLFFETNNNVGLIKTDSIANIQWGKEYKSNGQDHILDVPSMKLKQTNDGSYIFAYGNSFFIGGILKVDDSGNVEWHNELNFKTREVIETINHEYLALGNGPLEGVKGYYQMGLYQLDAQGNGTECAWPLGVQIEEPTINSQAVDYNMESNALNDVSNTIDVSNKLVSVREGCVDFYGAINDENTKDKLSIYPNPNQGLFTIENIQKQGHLMIYNPLGELIHKTQLTNSSQTMDLGHHRSGIYFYQFESDGAIINSGKLIILE
ncbi:MAG: T9SS type A sorting domain-containing protein [Bacteroidales bacterium]|nr:T9SS type A sorting domain-containing protein [Bacteroidales bacterium]